MADVEDDAEFGSHFLDSMLEVEMTEDDNELDVSKNCDPLETFPPIPTFDLQSETLSYKDVYKTTIPQPIISTLPLPPPPKVPLLIKPNSVLVYSGEVKSSKSTPAPEPIPKIPPKLNAKIPLKKVFVNTSLDKSTNEKFVEEVFRPEFVKNVFVKADPPWDIAEVSEEEMKFYKTCFKDVSKVQYCRLHCTICDKHLGCAATAEKKINVHNMLQVLTCKPCYEFYGDGNFPCDKGDNCEIYCRWCGQGGALVCCSFCPRVFCKKCVKRNYGPSFLKSIEKASDWACFCCAQKPLWPHRAICRALLEYLTRKKTDPKSSLKDTTSCCKAAGLVRKRLRTMPPPQEKTKIVFPQSTQLKINPIAKLTDVRSKVILTPKPAKEQSLLNPTVQQKANDRIKGRPPLVKTSKPSAITSIFSPRSILTGNNIIRGITTSTPTKLFSTFPSPQLIQSPVIHGETLITPPSRFLVQAKPQPKLQPKPQPQLQPKLLPQPKPPSTPNLNSSSYVKVSLTHQVPNLDVKKIPTVKIPHEVQGLVLRLIFPDNKMQYVRLASDGTGCKASKEFPMPSFRENGASFVEENLAEAFKVSKMMYEKLMRIREKVNSRTKFTEESVFNSSVKKLRLAYENAMDLFKELDKTLMENHEEWTKEAKNSVDVIDISDDETGTAKKSKPNRYSILREKCKKLSDDSDIEILDDVTVNGKTSANVNYKEKYRLRSTSEHGKTHANNNGVGRKRKMGRGKRHNKRLKMVGMQNGEPKEDPLAVETETNETGGETKREETEESEPMTEETRESNAEDGQGEEQTDAEEVGGNSAGGAATESNHVEGPMPEEEVKNPETEYPEDC